MHVMITAAREALVLSQAPFARLEEGTCRLTGKETFFLFSSAGSRQRSTWTFVVCGQPDIACIAERVERL